MKSFLRHHLLLICILFISQSLFAKEYIPEFVIKGRSVQANLPSDSALLVFKFYESTQISKSKITIGMNDESFVAELNENGEFKKMIKKGTYTFYFYLQGYEEVITDSLVVKSQEKLVAEIHFSLARRMVKPAKPVIYVYPEVETQMNIELDVIGQLGFTYPTYENGWNFTAFPNGDIQMNDKTYGYLFWESEMPESELKYEKTGFLVHSDTLLSFLENSLSTMGLNSKESADFITYWYPQMLKNKTNHIHFLFNEACNTYADLNITPTPDHIYRVGMLWTEAKTNFVPDSQIISSLNRNGFTVIEWGGIEVKSLFNLEK